MRSRGDLPGGERPKLRLKPGFGPGGVRIGAADVVEAPKPRGRAPGTVPPPVTPVHAMANARVVDIAVFNRMKERGETAGKVSKWLGVSAASAVMLLAGEHWQQDPLRIALFNEYRGTSLPVSGPEMGFAPADVIAQYGGASGKRKASRTPGEQAMVDLVKRSGVSGVLAEEVARALEMMAGAAEMPAERLDSAYFLEEVERKLALGLASLTPVKIAGASVGDLQKLVSMLVEKRALLRGEPTQIVSHRERRRIDEVLPMLVAAAQKRGVVLDLTARVVEEAGDA